jgi:hypothetical protein
MEDAAGKEITVLYDPLGRTVAYSLTRSSRAFCKACYWKVSGDTLAARVSGILSTAAADGGQYSSA